MIFSGEKVLVGGKDFLTSLHLDKVAPDFWRDTNMPYSCEGAGPYLPAPSQEWCIFLDEIWTVLSYSLLFPGCTPDDQMPYFGKLLIDTRSKVLMCPLFNATPGFQCKIIWHSPGT